MKRRRRVHDKPPLLISRGGTGWVIHALSTHFTRERSGTVPLLKIIHTLSTDLSTDYPQSVRSLVRRAYSVSRRTRPEASEMGPINTVAGLAQPERKPPNPGARAGLAEADGHSEHRTPHTGRCMRKRPVRLRRCAARRRHTAATMSCRCSHWYWAASAA